jgi:protein subunit release factor B
MAGTQLSAMKRPDSPGDFMIDFPVSPAKRTALESRMADLGILESDLDEKFTHSRGNGGQNVNKVSTCVILTHIPTGLAVRCEEERSQGLNRYRARQRLADMIDVEINGVRAKKSIEIDKLRKQKQNRHRKSVKKNADPS